MAKAPFLLALDAGGTMTDTFLVDSEGDFVVGKALTNGENEAESFIASISDAARYWKLDEKLLAQAFYSVYTGTAMINLLLTRSGRNVGIIVNKGFINIC